MDKKFYLTTAIPYVNARPHIGHALEFVQADVVARHHRQNGTDTSLLSGADENSLKNVQAAEKEGVTPKELCDKNSKYFQDLAESLNISFDFFQRSTESKHFNSSQKLWDLCLQSGDIYKKSYVGLYCVGCEAFYTENELVNGFCPEHKARPEKISEENYFFKLSKYQGELEQLLSSGQLRIVPETRKNEALGFIKQGLEDFSISRSKNRARGWGVPVPDDPEQIMYVWFDALNIYQSGVGFGWNEESYKKWWPADLHVIGKGILRFHAVYWPAILLSAKLQLPKSIFVHGYLTIEGQKMSKTLGNVVDPFDLVNKYGADPVRYFLLREIPPTEDGDFSILKFEQRYNSDLAKGLGNLVSRVITLAAKFDVKSQNPTSDYEKKIQEVRSVYDQALGEYRFNDALVALWSLISWCDKYIEREKPWEGNGNSKEVISCLLHCLNFIADLLVPFLPETAEKIILQIKNNRQEALFPRIEN